MKIQAVGKYLVVVPVDAPERMGGLEIPESQKERIRQRPIGRVVAVGGEVNKPTGGTATEPGVCKEPITEGDIVLYGQGNSMHLHGLDGKIYWIVDRDFIVGHVVEDKSASGEEMEAISARQAKIEAEQSVLRAAAAARGSLVTAAGLSKPRLVN